MADNYIENKMEEHARRGQRPASFRLTHAGRKAGFALLPYNISTAFITAPEPSILLETIASELSATGCRTAISCPGAARLAQATGCAYVAPSANAEEAIKAKWGDIELRVNVAADQVDILAGRCESHIRRASDTTAEAFAKRAAELLIYITLPDSTGRIEGDFTV